MRIVPRNVVHFGYEVRCHGSVAIGSPNAFVTEAAAFAAACRFIDDVDRRMGLGQDESDPSGEGA